jgi:hypothetical protein
MKNMCVVLLFLFVLGSSFAEDETPESVVHYNESYLFRGAAEGNFTNSGKREIIAFYQAKRYEYIEGKPYYALQATHCFVLNDEDNVILKEYEIDYRTGRFGSDEDLRLMPVEVLERDILWMDYSIGKISDFNENGREELYLYRGSGMGFFPSFYEYDPETDEFRQLLEPPIYAVWVEIINVDKINKQIDFKIIDQGNVSYQTRIWDEVERKYIKTERIVDAPPAEAEPEEPVISLPSGEPEAYEVEEDPVAAETVAVTSNRVVLFAAIAAAAVLAAVIALVMSKKRKRP